MIKAVEIANCRLCDSPNLVPFFSTGELYITDFPKEPNGNRGKADMTLVRCEKCTLIQLQNTVDSEVYFEYWYQSKLNPKIVNNLRNIVNSVKEEVELKEGDWVLDIGANDGTLLSFYQDLPVTRVGCDPARSLQADLEKNCEHRIGGLWDAREWNKITDKKAKVITAISMFYDLDAPHQFLKDIAAVLDPNGIFVVQFMPARTMIDTNDIGNVCHEHLLYYTYPSLVQLFEQNGLEIYKVTENDINGGSYQLWTRHATGNGSVEYNEDCSIERLEEWVRQIEENKDKTVAFIRQEVADGKKVYLYGASTKGNTIVQWYGLDEKDIAGAAEIHPDKIGRYIVGTEIPIVAEEEARKDADYFLIIGFGFRDVFVKKEQPFLDQGGKLIFCTPEFEVIES